MLELPLQSFDISIGTGTMLERDFRPYRVLDLDRLYAADTWRVGLSLTLNAGLGWSYEPNALNHDLTKPLFLSPLLEERGLKAPVPRRTTLRRCSGLHGRRRLRTRRLSAAAAGRFFDPASGTNSTNLGQERWLLSPLGTGRLTVSGANILRNGQPVEFSVATHSRYRRPNFLPSCQRFVPISRRRSIRKTATSPFEISIEQTGNQSVRSVTSAPIRHPSRGWRPAPAQPRFRT